MRAFRDARSLVLTAACCLGAVSCGGDAEEGARSGTRDTAIASASATPGYGIPAGQPAVPFLKGPAGKLAKITVRPRVATSATRPRVEIENIVDRPLGRGNYHVNLTGPGRKACDKTLRWHSGYHPRTNASETVRATLRTGTQPGFNRGKSWCPGRFEVFVEFRDFSAPERDCEPPSNCLTAATLPLGRAYFRVVR